MNEDIPPGWSRTSLGDVADVFNGKGAGTGGTWLRVFKTRHVYDGFVRLSDPAFVPDERASAVPKTTYLRSGDTLTPNMAHGTIGRVAFARDAGEAWTVDGQVMVIRPKTTDQAHGRFLFDWISRAESKQFLINLEKGGAFDERRGQTHIYAADVRRLPVLLPPISEQRRIADILSSVDEAIEATDAVIAQLQVVKKAMIAELLARGLPGRHTRFKETEIGHVPESWRTLRLGEVLSETAYGTSAKCGADPIGSPVLRIPNVVSGRVSLAHLKYAALSSGEMVRYALSEGDVLIVRTNGNPDYVGRSAVVPPHDGIWLFASYLIRLKVRRTLLEPSFLHYALQAEAVRRTMQGAIRTSAGNYNLNTEGITRTLVPLPALSEQQEIVSVLDNVTRRLDAEYEARDGQTRLKCALMSALLTGEIRVRPDNSSEAAA